MRNTFINTICELAEKNEEIFLLCGDLGYSVLEPFLDKFSDRFLNVGIAEQNMTQVAAGLASEGYNVFTYSIGNFPTLRCMEQIRYDVCYHNRNVKIVAVGAGYAYGPQGVSHHTTEDIAMMRSIPNMTICSPADASEAKDAAIFMSNAKGPGYIRLNKSGEPLLQSKNNDFVFKPGKFLTVREGSTILVLVTGAIAHPILLEINSSGNDWALWSAPFIGNYDQEMMISICKNFSHVITIEEHQLNGGFGSSIIESFSDLYAKNLISNMPKVKRVAIPNLFIACSGSQEYLRDLAGLNLKNIINV